MFSDFGDSSFYQEPDFLLTDLVSLMVNKSGMQIGITLLVEGAVVTGTLVSERDYLEALSEAFVNQARRAVPPPSKADLDMLRGLFDFKELAEDEMPEDEDESDESDEEEDEEDVEFAQIRFLHLKDPTILLPQPSLTFSQGDLSIMRIRLTAIDGWLLGRSTLFSPDDDGPPILH